MAFDNESTLHQILQRLDRLEAQVAYLSQAQGSAPQAGYDAAPAPIGPGMVPAPAGPGDPAAAFPQVVALARSRNKIEAIRLYREMTGADLRTAKAFVDQF